MRPDALVLRVLRRQAGHTLLEWLIAAALALVALGGALTLYRSQRDAFSRSVDAARMREAGAAALTLLGQHIQMAGYAPVDQPALRASVTPGLFGCESARPALGGADDEPACLLSPSGFLGFAGALGPSNSSGVSDSSDSDSIVVRYIDDGVATWRSASGEPTDCLGQGVPRHGEHAVVVNRFYAARPSRREEPELYCAGNGRAMTPQPLVEGVERMTLRYWLRGAAEPVGAWAIPRPRWGDVMAVDLCVVVRGHGIRGRKAWVDCEGRHTVSADGRERLSLTRHLVLRNQGPVN
jgi:type IV pilus assembly protein PilW